MQKKHTYKPLVIAHRGSKALFPENTMTAFEGSLSLGVDALEIDVRLTKDSILVAHHDVNIDRTSNGKGAVSDYTYKELQFFNFAHHFQDLNGNFPYRKKKIHIPKLTDIMKKYPHILLILDIKDKGKLGKKSVQVLKEVMDSQNTPSHLMVSSFDYKAIHHFRKIIKRKIITGSSLKESVKYYFAHLLHLSNFISNIPYGVVQVPKKIKFFHLANERYIASLHQRDIAVQFWTINSKEDMKALIHLNADGIITDRPDLMHEVLGELGYHSNQMLL